MTTVRQQIPDEFEDIVPTAATGAGSAEPHEFEHILLPEEDAPPPELPKAAPSVAADAQMEDSGAALSPTEPTAAAASAAAIQMEDGGAANSPSPRDGNPTRAPINRQSSTEEVRELCCDKLARRFLQSNPAKALSAIIAWQCVFTAWYHFHNKFTWAQAFYYSAQAGFSVGFGALTESCEGGICSDDTDGDGRADNMLSQGAIDASHAMTVLNILLGSSVIGGALSFFTAWVLKQKEGWEDDAREITQVKQKAKLLGLDPMLAVQRQLRKKLTSVQNWKVYALLTISITTGIVFGVVHEDWTFLQSLYFSISSMSTAGLQAVNNPRSNGAMWFAGIFIYISVPTYAMGLGMFAGALTKHMEQAKTVEMLSQRMTAEDFRCASRKHNGEHQLQFGEYLELQLLRTGTADQDFIDRCRAKFKRIDISGDGRITIDEMMAENTFAMFDVDENGKLTFEEFSDCYKALRAQHANIGSATAELTQAQLKEEFQKVNTERWAADEQEAAEGDKKEEGMSRRNFLKWMHTSGFIEGGAEAMDGKTVAAHQA